MPTTTLALTSAPQKYGLVMVFNPDGTVNRQYKITSEEYHALGQKGAGAPPGLTESEWQATRSVLTKQGEEQLRPLAVALGKDYEEGSVWVLADGACQCKLRETFDGTQYQETFLTLPAKSFTGVPPAITIKPLALATLDQSKLGLTITSIQDGVVTWR